MTRGIFREVRDAVSDTELGSWVIEPLMDESESQIEKESLVRMEKYLASARLSWPT